MVDSSEAEGEVRDVLLFQYFFMVEIKEVLINDSSISLAMYTFGFLYSSSYLASSSPFLDISLKYFPWRRNLTVFVDINVAIQLRP